MQLLVHACKSEAVERRLHFDTSSIEHENVTSTENLQQIVDSFFKMFTPSALVLFRMATTLPVLKQLFNTSFHSFIALLHSLYGGSERAFSSK